jgi:hypothetical protein
MLQYPGLIRLVWSLDKLWCVADSAVTAGTCYIIHKRPHKTLSRFLWPRNPLFDHAAFSKQGRKRHVDVTVLPTTHQLNINKVTPTCVDRRLSRCSLVDSSWSAMVMMTLIGYSTTKWERIHENQRIEENFGLEQVPLSQSTPRPSPTTVRPNDCPSKPGDSPRRYACQQVHS